MIDLFKKDGYDQTDFMKDLEKIGDAVTDAIIENQFFKEDEERETQWEIRKEKISEMLRKTDFNYYMKRKMSINRRYGNWGSLGYVYEGIIHILIGYLKDSYFDESVPVYEDDKGDNKTKIDTLSLDDVTDIEVAFDSIETSTISMLNLAVNECASLPGAPIEGNDLLAIFESSVITYLESLSYFERIIRRYDTDGGYREFKEFLNYHRGKIVAEDIPRIENMGFPMSSSFAIEDTISSMIDLINPVIYKMYEEAYMKIEGERSQRIFSTEKASAECASIDLMYHTRYKLIIKKRL